MRQYKIKKKGIDFIFVQEERIFRGTRKKILVLDNKNNMAMFKYEKENYDCSEACSEKMAYEIAKILNYSCAKIELAYDDDSNLGVLNYYFTKDNSLHNDFVAYLNNNKKDRKYFYTIKNIKCILDNLDKKLFKDFIKIMIFDALIGEQDRHEENWGITEYNGKYFISPLYDNGASLLREFQNDNTFQKYYNHIKDFDKYIKRSRTYIYKENSNEKYKHFELIEYLLYNYPSYVLPELENLKKLSDVIIKNIVKKIPDELLTEMHKKYIIDYVVKRRNILLEIGNIG